MHTVPDSIGRMYERPGPFVTAIFDATRATESGPHEVELRWQELRHELTGSGADEKDLSVVDEALAEDTGIAGRHGRVVVAAGGDVLLDDVLPDPPARPRASVAALPDLVPFLAARRPAVPYVLVVADHAGADVVAVPAEFAAAGRRPDGASIEGSRPYPLHRTARDQWDERHFQNRVENSWATNARDVADEVRSRVESVGAELVLLAGDPRARALLRDDVPGVLDPSVQVVELDAGARADGASAVALDEAVHSAVLRYSWRRRREVLEHLQQNLGRERYAVAGSTAVLDALRRSQADTVVLSDDPSSTLPAWIGPEPLQVGESERDLAAMGVSDPQRVRFDSALLRAVVGSGAELLVTPNAHEYVSEGIAALLRYDDASTRS